MKNVILLITLLFISFNARSASEKGSNIYEMSERGLISLQEANEIIAKEKLKNIRESKVTASRNPASVPLNEDAPARLIGNPIEIQVE